jgi:hypothetical protein
VVVEGVGEQLALEVRYGPPEQEGDEGGGVLACGLEGLRGA